MYWLNEPATWEAQGDTLTVTADPKTDFWRKTDDGGVRDTGHCYYERVMGDFVAEVKVSGEYAAQYDQAGLMVRLDEVYWMKCGIELFNDVQQASAVVTNEYSDWSIVPLPQNPPAIWLRVTRKTSTLSVYYSLDGETYTLLRMAYLTSAEVEVGPMCAAPTGDGFRAVFEGFGVRPLRAAE
ncbi:MAG: DUF1349 domain-containing protein [Anaerolineae bacterium]|nr:DUF1349 domain-containing protein [Anaerolineae bacterium]